MKRLIQTGPTCGFYCLEYAMALQEEREPSEDTIKKMMESAGEDGRTVTGEIFTSKDMTEIFNKTYGSRGEISKRRLVGKEQLKTDMLCGTVIMPVLTKFKIPHYYVIEKRKKDNLFIYDPGNLNNKEISIEKLIKMNRNLKKLFSWDEYFKKARFKGLYYLIKDYARSSNMAKTVQKLRRDGKEAYQLGMLPKEAKLDINGIFFIIRKAEKP